MKWAVVLVSVVEGVGKGYISQTLFKDPGRR